MTSTAFFEIHNLWLIDKISLYIVIFTKSSKWIVFDWMMMISNYMYMYIYQYTVTFKGHVNAPQPHVYRNVSSYLPCWPRLVFGPYVLRFSNFPLISKICY